MFVKSINNKMSSDPMSNSNIDFFSINWIFQPLLTKRTRRPRTAEYCMLTTAPTSTCVNQFDRDTGTIHGTLQCCKIRRATCRRRGTESIVRHWNYYTWQFHSLIRNMPIIFLPIELPFLLSITASISHCLLGRMKRIAIETLQEV